MIVAIGQTLNTGELFDGVKLKLNEREYIGAEAKSGRTSVDWVFAGGDAVSGPASVVDAVGAGERGAVAIDRYLTGAEHASWREERANDTAYDPDADPVLSARAAMRLIPAGHRKHSFAEVETTWRKTVAVAQAKRCLRCDYREEEK